MTSNILKRPRGRPSKTVEQQEIENLKGYTDDQLFALARPPTRGRLATEELIRRYKVNQEQLLEERAAMYEEI